MDRFISKELALERLERIARNLPVMPGTLIFGRVPVEQTEIYIAVGRGPGTFFDGVSWYGIYGFWYGDDRLFGRHGEIKGDESIRVAQQEMLDDAMSIVPLFAARGMFEKDFRPGKPNG